MCALDLSYLVISFSETSTDGQTTYYNYVLLPQSRIQLPLLTFGSRWTGKNITHTKTLKKSSKQANIGALGLKAKIPSYLTNTNLMFHVSLLSGADNDNERASHFSPRKKPPPPLQSTE
jgi:hypothetical protein